MLRGIVRTAAVAGTATAVSNGVSRRVRRVVNAARRCISLVLLDPRERRVRPAEGRREACSRSGVGGRARDAALVA